jgi:hypothetical protein
MTTAQSVVRWNAEKDPAYRPYCLRCKRMGRMNIVSPFLWKCPCGAVHDERTIHERVGQALGWTDAEVKSFSFQALRELIRPVDPALARELDEAIRTGKYIVG